MDIKNRQKSDKHTEKKQPKNTSLWFQATTVLNEASLVKAFLLPITPE
jgi:hypothetical protein